MRIATGREIHGKLELSSLFGEVAHVSEVRQKIVPWWDRVPEFLDARIDVIGYVRSYDVVHVFPPLPSDALPFLGWRSVVSDEDWVDLGGLKDDADYFQRVFTDTGVDLRSTRPPASRPLE